MILKLLMMTMMITRNLENDFDEDVRFDDN